MVFDRLRRVAVLLFVSVRGSRSFSGVGAMTAWFGAAR
jgi:hypothetical protein